MPPSPDYFSTINEVDRVQNPALGALLLWQYGRAYQENLTANTSHLLLFFLVLPICLHRPTLDFLSGTQEASGLGKFCEKLAKNREELFAVHERCLTLRPLTLRSVVFGTRANLFSVEYQSGALRALDGQPPKLAEEIAPHVKGARKLGVWFRTIGELEIFKSLKVDP